MPQRGGGDAVMPYVSIVAPAKAEIQPIRIASGFCLRGNDKEGRSFCRRAPVFRLGDLDPHDTGAAARRTGQLE